MRPIIRCVLTVYVASALVDSRKFRLLLTQKGKNYKFINITLGVGDKSPQSFGPYDSKTLSCVFDKMHRRQHCIRFPYDYMVG